NGKVITTLPIGEGVDANAFDQETGFAFASCGEGVLTVAHEDSPDKFSAVENAPTQRGARTMALDPKTHQIFLLTAPFGPPPAAIQMPAVRESLLRHHLAYETRRFRLLPALGLAGACRSAPFHSASLHI